MKTNEHKAIKALKARHNLRDNMTEIELALINLAEVTATALHRQRDSQGFPALRHDAGEAGQVGGAARMDIEERMGVSVVSAENAQSLTSRQAKLFPDEA